MSATFCWKASSPYAAPAPTFSSPTPPPRSPPGSKPVDQKMNATTSFLCRDVTAIKPWTETCGQIRPLIEEKDGAAAEVHHLEITDAKLHYHQHTDEIYYVLDGTGRMRLDDQEIDLHKDV